MFIRLVRLIIRFYARGPARSSMYTAAATMVINGLRSLFGRQELIDVSNIKPGEVIVIEQLTISHREQIRQFKKADRKAKRAARQDRRAAKREVTGRILRSGSGRERHSA
jgi:hypothetical protein